ncbi:MAG: hypothetical protein AAF378_14480 [Cyanobacteria bacterium P01_A01_bin.84]
MTNSKPNNTNDVKPNINLNAELRLEDYITSVPASEKTTKELSSSIAKQREAFRSKLAMRLTKIFGFSLGASFLLILITSIHPNAKQAETKDLILAVITPQVTLLSFALGFYFGSNKES